MFSGQFYPTKPLTSYSKWVDSITHIRGNGYRKIGEWALYEHDRGREDT